MECNESYTCDSCEYCPRNLEFDSWEGHQGICTLKNKKIMLANKICSFFKRK